MVAATAHPQAVLEDDLLIITVEINGVHIPVYLQKDLSEHQLWAEKIANVLPELWQALMVELESLPTTTFTQHNLNLPLVTSNTEATQQWELTFALINDNRMRELNQYYRNKDTSTDVLTFPAYTDSALANMTTLPEIDLGCIVVSLDWAKTHAEKESLTVESFLLERFIHGCLHSFGIHHDTKEKYQQVVSIQKNILKQVSNCLTIQKDSP